MRLDQGSLIFKPLNGECPSWETSLGQSHEGNGELPPYHFKAEGYENILKGLIFNSVPLNTVSCILGKTKEEVNADTSYQFTKTQEIQLAGKFDKVIVHFGGQEKSFVDAPFTLLLTKIQDGNKYHFGRRSIKYSPHTIADGVKNSDSFEKIQSRFGERLACYGLFVEHFDTLHLYCVSADTYYDKNNWKDFSLPETEWTDWVEWEKEVRKNIPPQVNQVPAPKPSKSFTPAQIIYYGVPGCGKSFNVDQDIDKKLKDYGITDKEYHKVRCVFHPEYTSADFIGQIFPCVGENGHGIDYRFKAGPFTEILRRAYLNPQKQFYLVIEEINRGNAAAIFSDVFQLLDRLKDGKTDSVGGNTYKNGWSQYFVDNADVNAYIRKEEVFLNEIDDNNRDAIHLGVEPSSDKDLAGCYKSIKIKDCNGCEINFSVNTAIRLPPNLSILATMNTSDQNVFTLDNAFQRRFDMEMIPNELDTSDADSKVQYETVIGGAAEKSTGVSWGVFRDWINGKISNANTLLSTEDRCLGGWFVTGDSITDKKKFAEKVLKYLWDDAFKHNREIFKLKSLSEIVAKFVETNGSDAFKEIFGEVPEVKDAV